MNFIKYVIVGLCVVLVACSQEEVTTQARIDIAKEGPKKVEPATKPVEEDLEQVRQRIVEKYEGVKPTEWGEKVEGVGFRLDTRDKVIALTLDACGGSSGNGFDRKLIDYLEKEKIPATLFINSRWIDANEEAFIDLARNPLFEIENHGLQHRPLSVEGRSVYGIKGTENPGEVVDEVMINTYKIQHLTGKKPKFFRSGTAFYDDVAVRMVEEVGAQVVQFDIVGDAGATYSKSQVEQALLTARPGSIVILHMNQPRGETLEGIRNAVPRLREEGFQFVKLEDYPLKGTTEK
ncbi:polysaccharide deacetylase family protein [Kroppenstedtia pulmonis]|uniref:Polysaccharide deacetylase family protein n=1 Tax=Kroppenstedtia pulmonis TaxID=1380685 RepID=A0A7D4CVV2_9BACL|nr:polysaccharide deacetylase family protein [Kroppenstedtia pulmonis]QKG84597.1 polysaccharide deacetylase family protein [Kroppenstedtia pulmonis]